MITWPLTILHCCMVADHGGAVLVASPKVAAGTQNETGLDRGRGREYGPSKHAGDARFHRYLRTPLG